MVPRKCIHRSRRPMASRIRINSFLSGIAAGGMAYLLVQVIRPRQHVPFFICAWLGEISNPTRTHRFPLETQPFHIPSSTTGEGNQGTSCWDRMSSAEWVRDTSRLGIHWVGLNFEWMFAERWIYGVRKEDRTLRFIQLAKWAEMWIGCQPKIISRVNKQVPLPYNGPIRT